MLDNQPARRKPMADDQARRRRLRIGVVVAGSAFVLVGIALIVTVLIVSTAQRETDRESSGIPAAHSSVALNGFSSES
ncbi:hypothetical protein [Cryobacterium psychrophilum]|uniref:Uncharacterized protein n=1 Tax=Cryobacterium psychrophilum TaxID=41988 RepID=A0A4Y8KN89_9MICO|nr:hypothetical protein [Cryobacterium psychrophilum]TDW30704.1 hypothetical protein EDD25_2474 [Cryobacterium psychrophilum]TFD76613.1 hypothetical protein E3T53_13215 [Cryobacterium psychrophilum]